MLIFEVRRWQVGERLVGITYPASYKDVGLYCSDEDGKLSKSRIGINSSGSY